MRLEGQAKGGFFPCPLAAVAMVAKRIKRTAAASAAAHVFDPCAGEGEAIATLAALLSVDCKGVWAMELEDTRSATLTSRLKGCNVVGRCDFTFSEISSNSFSLVWLNPPFDDEAGGGSREELTFLERATHTLAYSSGILVFILPEPVLAGNYRIRDHLLCNYDLVSCTPFPEGSRSYREVVVMGVRRDGYVKANFNDWMYVVQNNRDALYTLHPSQGPRRFLSGGPTDSMIVEYVQPSPLLGMLRAPAVVTIGQPCLELEHGQTALVLAGGMLNGRVQLEGEEAFIVQATAFKEDYSTDTEEERDDGAGGTVTVVVRETNQRIRLKVRTLTASGKLKDLT